MLSHRLPERHTSTHAHRFRRKDTGKTRQHSQLQERPTHPPGDTVTAQHTNTHRITHGCTRTSTPHGPECSHAVSSRNVILRPHTSAPTSVHQMRSFVKPTSTASLMLPITLSHRHPTVMTGSHTLPSGPSPQYPSPPPGALYACRADIWRCRTLGERHTMPNAAPAVHHPQQRPHCTTPDLMQAYTSGIGLSGSSTVGNARFIGTGGGASAERP